MIEEQSEAALEIEERFKRDFPDGVTHPRAET